MTPIVLPPEPPRDRIIEETREDGTTGLSYRFDGELWRILGAGWPGGARLDWAPGVVWLTLSMRCSSLRSVPTRSED